MQSPSGPLETRTGTDSPQPTSHLPATPLPQPNGSGGELPDSPPAGETEDGEPQKLDGKAVAREIIETLLLTIFIFVTVNALTGRFKIDGASMNNTFTDGEYIIVSRFTYSLSPPERGDVVVFVPPGQRESTLTEQLIGLPGETDYIKRIIGIPGDRIEIHNGQLLVNGVLVNEPYIREPMRDYGLQAWELGPNEYFVMGDNRNASQDSRTGHIGPIPISRIVGKVWAVYFPRPRLADHYEYPEIEQIIEGRNDR